VSLEFATRQLDLVARTRIDQMDIVVIKGNTLQIPVIYNVKPIKSQTKLIVLDDMTLLKLTKAAKLAGEKKEVSAASGSKS
jgi:hypothetical protein